MSQLVLNACVSDTYLTFIAYPLRFEHCQPQQLLLVHRPVGTMEHFSVLRSIAQSRDGFESVRTKTTHQSCTIYDFL